MKTTITLMTLFILISCGKESVIDRVYIDNVVTNEVRISQDFEGVYYFKDGGFLEIIVGSDNEITLMREGQSIQSINPKNNTLCSHPLIYITGLESKGNKLKFFGNVNYTDGNDLEEDESGVDIRGSKRTDYEIKLLKNGRISLTIDVYSDSIGNNANYIIAKRVLNSF
jgi:hypothetical protein